jgi:hypothetical protein
VGAFAWNYLRVEHAHAAAGQEHGDGVEVGRFNAIAVA